MLFNYNNMIDTLSPTSAFVLSSFPANIINKTRTPPEGLSSPEGLPSPETRTPVGIQPTLGGATSITKSLTCKDLMIVFTRMLEILNEKKDEKNN